MPQQQPFCGGCVRTPRHLWVYSLVILLLFGFFKELKPSEAFLTPYLTNETDGKNLNVDDVNNKVYPCWTYSYLVAALIVFLLTDVMRYNPVILIESFAYLGTRVLLVWGTTILDMQMMQVVYGVATAAEVGYFAYIYSAVPEKYYEKVTGPVRAIVLFGRATSSFLGQILYSTGVLDYYGLNYFSFISVCIALGFSLLLPWHFSCSCRTSERERLVDIQEDPPVSSSRSWQQSCIVRTVVDWLKDFARFYSRPSLLKWSLWWAIAMCGVLQVGNFVQSLWKVILKETHNTGLLENRREWNGLVEGTTDLLAAGAALLASVLKINWPVWGEITMGSLALVDSLALLLASHTDIIWLAYGAHVIYRSSYAFMITIASSQIAIQLERERYGLVFGFNTFIALLLQTTLAVIVNTWLELGTRTQFVIYGIYYYCLVLAFVFSGVYKLTSTGWWRSIKMCCKPTQPSAEQGSSSLADSVQRYVTDGAVKGHSDSDSETESEDEHAPFFTPQDPQSLSTYPV